MSNFVMARLSPHWRPFCIESVLDVAGADTLSRHPYSKCSYWERQRRFTLIQSYKRGRRSLRRRPRQPLDSLRGSDRANRCSTGRYRRSHHFATRGRGCVDSRRPRVSMFAGFENSSGDGSLGAKQNVFRKRHPNLANWQ